MKTIINLILCTAGFFLVLALLLFNYAAILFLISGIATPPLISGFYTVFITKKYCLSFAEIVRFIRIIRQAFLQDENLPISLIFSLFICTYLFLPFYRVIEYSQKSPGTQIIDNYKVKLVPIDNSLRNFRLKEEIQFNQKWMKAILNYELKNKSSVNKKEIFPIQINKPIKISRTDKGLILREVYIGIGTLMSNINRNLISKLSEKPDCIDEFCFSIDLSSRIEVELVDFPVGSFYQVQDGENLKFFPYLDTERINWSISSSNSERGIRFAYIPPPFYFLRRFLNPLLKLAYINKWIIVVFGAIIAVISTLSKKQFTSVSNNLTYNLKGSNFGGGLITSDRVNTVQGNNNKIDQGERTMSDNRFINTGGGNYNERIQGNYVQGNYYAASQSQSLAQAAAEIQELLKQLEQTYFTDTTLTTPQQMVVAAEAINQIEKDPTMKQKVINAVKEGGLAAFEKAIDNPAGAFVVGAIKGWQEIKAKD